MKKYNSKSVHVKSLQSLSTPSYISLKNGIPERISKESGPSLTLKKMKLNIETFRK